jgi:hypothetical protein
MELDGNNQLKFPFLLVKPQEMRYAFIDWNISSIYFGIKEISEDIVQFYGISKNEIQNLNLGFREGEICNLKSLNWLNLAALDSQG